MCSCLIEDVDWLGHLADEARPTRKRVQDKGRNPRPHPNKLPLLSIRFYIGAVTRIQLSMARAWTEWKWKLVVGSNWGSTETLLGT